MKTSSLLTTGLLLVLASACKKDNPAKDTVTYEKLGDVSVNGLTGFARGGDPLGSAAGGDAIRWNGTTKQWERLGAPFTLANGTHLAAVGEDAAGNFYGNSTDYGNYVLAAGTTTWKPVALPDNAAPAYALANPPFLNGSGTVVMQTRRVTSSGTRERIYRKSAGAAIWELINDRPTDNVAIVSLVDNGDVILQNQGQGAPTAYVLKAGSAALVPLLDCAGTAILPYCGFQFGVSPAGDVVLHQGGTGSRQLYRLAAGATYPATAQPLYTLPDGTASFFDFAALSNGTNLGVANDGGYGTFHLFIRRAGAAGWQQAPDLPGTGYVYVRANRQGEVFTASRQSSAGVGSVYRVKL